MIEFHSDNAVAISYLQSQGGKIPELNEMAQEAWNLALRCKWWIQATYLPGRFQIAADPISRRKEMRLDWTLNRPVFQLLTATFFQPEVDLFTTAESAQVSRYVSWRQDPNAVGRDAFALQWSKLGGGSTRTLHSR